MQDGRLFCVKLPGQRSRIFGSCCDREVRQSLQASCGYDARLDGMTNKRELLINAVKNDRLKMLISLNQKVCGGLLLYSLGAHG